MIHPPILPSCLDFLIRKSVLISEAANTLRTLWIQNPTVSYHSVFGIGGSFLKSKTMEKISTASGYAGGPTIFLLPPIKRKEPRFCNLQKCPCILRANSNSHQQRARSSVLSWRHHSINIFCWLWVPPHVPQVKSKTLTYVQRPRLVGPSVRVLGSIVLLCTLGRSVTWRRRPSMLLAIILLNLFHRFDGGIRMNMRKAAHNSDCMSLLTPRCKPLEGQTTPALWWWCMLGFLLVTCQFFSLELKSSSNTLEACTLGDATFDQIAS